MQTAIDQQELQHLHRSANEQARASRLLPPILVTLGDFVDAGSLFDPSRQQISGSLQRLQLPEPSEIFPTADPYRPLPQPQGSILIPVIAFRVGAQHALDAEESARCLEATQPFTMVATPKVVASFVGRVESLIGDSANVLLINEQTDEHLESQCDADMLQENGIGVGDEFRCEVIRTKGTTATRLSRLSPKKLSMERINQIRARFKDRWTF